MEVQGKEGAAECRLCGLERETIGHILSSCPEHVWGLIKTRHDKMLYQLTKEIESFLESDNLPPSKIQFSTIPLSSINSK